MARPINSRLLVTGTLVARTPLHVGGFGDSAETDLPLAQNGRGDWYVPGTSIAGMLRGWCRENFGQAQLPNGNKLIDEVFGFQDGDKGQASFVLVEDATIENVNDIDTEVRDSVGIDRFYGVAADRAKYDRAILPRGTRVNFEMTVEIGAQKKPDPKAKENNGESDHEFEDRVKNTKAVIGYLLDAMQSERLRLGGAKTRGLGRVRLEDVSTKDQSFIGFDILNTLNGDGGSVTIEQLKGSGNLLPNPSPRLEISINWTPRLPVMVKAGYDGIGVDMLPLTSGVEKGKLALVLPGSSIKGVLRSHAERIVRTLLDCENQNEELNTKSKPNFHAQIDSIPLIETLFGARNKSKDKDNSSANNKGHVNRQAKPGLGALAIDDCYAQEKQQMKIDAWRAVEIGTVDNDISAKQWDIQQKLKAIPNASFRINHHVAIDRWTGGASEGALYSVLAPIEISWNKMCLTLDFGRIEKESQLPGLMLLLLVLRDVAENRLPFGFATNRGMGEIEVRDLEFIGSGKLEFKKLSEKDGKIVEEGQDIEIDLKDAVSATIAKAQCKFADGTLREQMQKRWKKWLLENRKS